MTDTDTSFPSLRVSQLDARQLDRSFVDIIVEQVNTVVGTLPSSLANALRRMQPEIRLIVRSLLHFGAMQRTGATLGQRTMGMRYAGAGRRAVWIYYALTVILPYVLQRLQLITALLKSDIPLHRLRTLADRVTTLTQMLDLVHFLYFLQRGGPSSVAQRVTGMQMVHAKQPQMGSLDFTVMNRELMWHGFADVLLLTMPLLDWRRTKNYICNKWWPTPHATPNGARHSMQITGDRPLTCGICLEYAVVPCTSECLHTFCYYCLHAHLMDDEEYECPQCAHKLTLTSSKFCFTPTVQKAMSPTGAA